MNKREADRLGQLVRKHRLAKQLTIRQAAEEAGLPHSTWQRIEEGVFGSPRPDKLQRLARVIDVPVEDLYALAGYLMPEGLPEFQPYLRAKYSLTDEQVADLEQYFDRITREFGGEDDKRHP